MDQYKLGDMQIISGNDHEKNLGEYASEIGQLPVNPRTWFLFSHIVDNVYIQEKDAILTEVGKRGELKRNLDFKRTATSLLLYNLRAP